MDSVPTVVYVNAALLVGTIAALAALPSAVAWLADRWLWKGGRRG